MLKQSKEVLQKSYGAYCVVVREKDLEPVPYYRFIDFEWINPQQGRKKYWIEKTVEMNGREN